MARLEEFAHAYLDRERELEDERAKLDAERAGAIRAAYRDGLSIPAIAEILSHRGLPISTSTVGRIVSGDG